MSCRALAWLLVLKFDFDLNLSLYLPRLAVKNVIARDLGIEKVAQNSIPSAQMNYMSTPPPPFHPPPGYHHFPPMNFPQLMPAAFPPEPAARDLGPQQPCSTTSSRPQAPEPAQARLLVKQAQHWLQPPFGWTPGPVFFVHAA